MYRFQTLLSISTCTATPGSPTGGAAVKRRARKKAPSEASPTEAAAATTAAGGAGGGAAAAAPARLQRRPSYLDLAEVGPDINGNELIATSPRPTLRTLNTAAAAAAGTSAGLAWSGRLAGSGVAGGAGGWGLPDISHHVIPCTFTLVC